MPLRPVLLAAMLVVAPLGVRAADLVVWWEKGFYAQEDEAVRETATGEGVPLGSGFDEVTGGLTAVKSQDPLVFVGGLSYTYAFEADGVRLGDCRPLGRHRASREPGDIAPLFLGPELRPRQDGSRRTRHPGLG